MAEPLRVAVVGGGIGGLTAALALQQAGIHVDVYEQTERFTEVGAGVTLAPNALRLLHRLGLADQLSAVGSWPTGYEVLSWHDGHVIIETHSSGPLQQMKSLTVHRGHLLKILETSVDSSSLHPGRRCTGVVQRDRHAVLSFQDGSTAAADAVVGADGIHSVIRSRYYDDRPVFSGTIAYRGLIPMERLAFLGVQRERLTWWLGPRQRFLTFAVASGALMNIVAFVPSDGSWAEESWTADGDVAELARHFADWVSPVPRIVAAFDSAKRWALYDRDPLPAWSFGRVTLLGDAAHAMLPHQGQGAGQSIEDAVMLARCLERAKPDTVDAWLRLYEAARRPRTGRVQAASRVTGEIYSLADAEEQERRAPSALETRGEWLWNYDADRAFEEALAASTLDATGAPVVHTER